ncbi:polysaccharide pyruvyl transferase family protein [Jeotgalibaca sp. MA1X17-3]|uniref:polysaccharide pyruvyl transferase family protein n=1 Tax=Jeotgalibaca sp. MA1X17-3 TaxID=2908211 RepID=UPI001F1E4FC7|nr:polysaccharide pyruvyl transferase family protein [Jeotgalibaca sp. MA1X17-3]UJF15259.1 polysaccharide pyruvyl transferase family protein [Jeotgalibaca sp. MA1X17-3]
MKKVAILTLNGYFNYGNRLQNYALQEVIRNLGFEVETIVNTTQNEEVQMAYPLKMYKIIKKGPKYLKKIILNKLNKKKVINSGNIRTKTFKDFTHKYIKETNYSISDKNIPNDLSEKYDYFVVGSDQVWNPNFREVTSLYFLLFTEKNKRVSYAPSFGVSELSNEYKSNYKKWLTNFDKISVREDDGAEIIKELTGKTAPVLVDPTLLITKETWLSIAKRANNKPEKGYLLTYFLGGVPKQYSKRINDIAKENNLDIINLGDVGDIETYKTGPSEFIDYINSCSIFCTDSFHGCVFAILMQKPFIVYEREGSSLSMYSRINTLLDKFNLNSRKIENIKTNKDAFNIEYTDTSLLLEEERLKSLNFLNEALEVTKKTQ